MAIGSTNGGGRRRIMADINITPLTDVFLVLLIIFMITTSAMMKPEDVQLPENAEEQQETQGVMVTMTPSREIYVNDRPVTGDDPTVVSALRDALANSKDKVVILAGDRQVIVAGGQESMSNAPYYMYGMRNGVKLGDQKIIDGMIKDGLWCAFCDVHMGGHAEYTAKKAGISRTDQDQFAAASHRKAIAAQEAGKFKAEIAPVEIKSRKGVTLVDKDDHMRPDTTLDVLATLPAAFKKDGIVTAGNASGIVDGAAALVIAGESAAKTRRLQPIGRIVSWATVGVEPTMMGMGPAPAIRKALEKAKLSLADLDLIEINEAFAAQYLACEKELGLDREKVNVNGGAIALGHPLGASGARLLLTLLLELRRRGKRYGVASACIGGGQGIAMIVEAV